MTLRGFADELSMDSPAPGGGSVAALCGALSAAPGGHGGQPDRRQEGLRGGPRRDGRHGRPGPGAQGLRCSRPSTADTQAFNKVMEAFRLPKTTPEQAAEKDRAVEEANKEATLVPVRRPRDGGRSRRAWPGPPRPRATGTRSATPAWPAWPARRPAKGPMTTSSSIWPAIKDAKFADRGEAPGGRLQEGARQGRARPSAASSPRPWAGPEGPA
ncbi:MAG: cyclodeaminase/cyclohydrolase family protein [Desulfobacterales bacterium]|nr:cyclodeaminase/cyclohydrolase family protein [Desulfobacterales bacterium]